MKQKNSSHDEEVDIGSSQKSLEETLREADRMIESTTFLIQTLELGQTMQLHLQGGDLDKAVDLGRERIDLAVKSEDPQILGMALRATAFVQAEAGDYIGADINLEKCLELEPDSTSGSTEHYVALGIQAALQAGLGRFDRSFEIHEQMVELARQDQEPDKEIEASLLSALDCLFLDDETAARLRLRESLHLASSKGLPNPRICALLAHGLGLFAYARGNYSEAIQAWESYRDIAHILTAHPGRSDLAGVPKALALQLLSLARAKLGDGAAAIRDAERAVDLLRQANDSLGLASSLEALGSVHLLAGNLDQARKAACRAIDQYEEIRNKTLYDEQTSISMLDAQSTAYGLFQQVEAESGRPEKALQMAEWSRGRTLYSRLQDSEADSEMPPLDRLRKIVHRAQATVVVYSVIYEPIAFPSQHRFQSGQPKVEKALYLWVVEPAGDIHFRSLDLVEARVAGHSLASKIIRFREAVREGYDLTEISEGLYQTLIAPIESWLKGTRLIFVPEGPIFQISIGALFDAEGKTLGDRYECLLSVSIRMLDSAAAPTRPWSEMSSLVVGDPRLDKVTDVSAQLPFAEVEALWIAELLGTRAVVGKSATPGRLLRDLVSAELIHIASHNDLEHQDGRVKGALLLAADADGTNTLSAERLIDLRGISAELLVLSACETGHGRITSDGILNLAWAFQIAGAKSIVVSLWRNQDLSTALLMDRFYRNLLSSTDSSLPEPCTALRSAQHWLRDVTADELVLEARRLRIHEGSRARRWLAVQTLALCRLKPAEEKLFSHPKFWAPFVVLGTS